MTAPRKRLLYFNSVGNHDIRLLSRLHRLADRWDVLYVTVNPNLAKQMQQAGLTVRLLLEEGRGYDDWHRPAGYGPVTKWRLKRDFQFYREKYRQILHEFKTASCALRMDPNRRLHCRFGKELPVNRHGLGVGCHG